GRLLNRYKPATPVLAVSWIPVAGFVTSTVALGTVAPVGSMTVPTRFPSIVCANTHGPKPISASIINVNSIADFVLHINRPRQILLPIISPYVRLKKQPYYGRYKAASGGLGASFYCSCL